MKRTFDEWLLATCPPHTAADLAHVVRVADQDLVVGAALREQGENEEREPGEGRSAVAVHPDELAGKLGRGKARERSQEGEATVATCRRSAAGTVHWSELGV